MDLKEEIEIDGVAYVRKDSITKLGKRKLIRCRNAGVHVGEVVKRENGVMYVKNSNWIHRWRGARTLNEMSLRGVTRDNYTRITAMVPELELTCSDVCEVITCSEGLDLSEVWND